MHRTFLYFQPWVIKLGNKRLNHLDAMNLNSVCALMLTLYHLGWWNKHLVMALSTRGHKRTKEKEISSAIPSQKDKAASWNRVTDGLYAWLNPSLPHKVPSKAPAVQSIAHTRITIFINSFAAIYSHVISHCSLHFTTLISRYFH